MRRRDLSDQASLDAADRRRWQRRAAALLVDLLAEAAERRLPALPWQVTNAGARLVATAPIGEAPEQWAAFQAWSQYLGADLTVERRELPTRAIAMRSEVRCSDVDVVLAFTLLAGYCRQPECDELIPAGQAAAGRTHCATHGGVEVPDATA